MKSPMITLYFFCFSCISFTSEVVFLHGTSCSGKTSICKEFQSDSWNVVDEDAIYYQEVSMDWKQQFPEQFESIEQAIEPENMLHAVMRNQLLFKYNAPNEARNRAKQAIRCIQEKLNSREDKTVVTRNHEWHKQLREKITDKIKKIAQKNNVIVETWFLNLEYIQQVEDEYPTTHVLAYCPFHELVMRTITRNNIALMNGKNISSMRFFHQPLTSFSSLFALSDSDLDAIDSINEADVQHSMDIVKLSLTESSDATGESELFTRGEFSIKQFEEYKNTMLNKFEDHNTLLVVPTKKYDKIIRTDKQNSAECAQSILSVFEQKAKEEVGIK